MSVRDLLAPPQAPPCPRERALGVLCATLSVGLFSSFTLASRLGYNSALHWHDLAALRFGIGGLLLLPVLLRRGMPRASGADAAALACFGGFGFALLAYAGFALAPAAHGAVLLHGTLPLFTFALTRRGAPQPGARPRFAGLVLIAAGIAAMALDSWTRATPRQLAGDAALLLASLSWSAYGVHARRLGAAPAQSAAVVAVLSMACFLPIYALLPGKALLAVGARELLLQALVQGVLIGAVSIFVYTRAVAALGPATVALFTAAVPCVTTLAAIPLLAEHPGGAAIAGIAAVTAGMLAALQPFRWRKVASP